MLKMLSRGVVLSGVLLGALVADASGMGAAVYAGLDVNLDRMSFGSVAFPNKEGDLGWAEGDENTVNNGNDFSDETWGDTKVRAAKLSRHMLGAEASFKFVFDNLFPYFTCAFALNVGGNIYNYSNPGAGSKYAKKGEGDLADAVITGYSVDVQDSWHIRPRILLGADVSIFHLFFGVGANFARRTVTVKMNSEVSGSSSSSDSSSSSSNSNSSNDPKGKDVTGFVIGLDLCLEAMVKLAPCVGGEFGLTYTYYGTNKWDAKPGEGDTVIKDGVSEFSHGLTVHGGVVMEVPVFG